MWKRLVAPVASFSMLISATCFAAAQNRLTHEISADAARVPLANSVSGRARAATDLGIAASDRQITDLSLRFSRSAQQQAALTQLLADQQNPQSPRYHQWLTPEQFADQFGLSPADVATAARWLQSQGFNVDDVARSRTFISFSGSVGQIKQAFGVSLHQVSVGGEQHFANLTDPTLPSSLSKVVLGITGLNDLRLKPRGRLRTIPAKAAYNGGSNYGNLVAPADFNAIYDLKPLLTNSINGSGITIAVVGQTDFQLSDVTAFRSAAGLPTNLPTVKTYGTDPGSVANDIPEASLDVEWAGAIAPSASILYVNGKDVFANSMTQAIDNNLAPIITVSYGDCESGFGGSSIAQYNALFQQANAQGQTIVGPAGDSGAADCDYNDSLAINGLAVDFPASSPYVTGVGGSEFNEGGGNYWSATNSTGVATALSYIPEQPWNETFDITTSGTLFGLQYGGAGGGGVSQVFAKPAWQTGTGVPADFSRDVPDIAFNAAADHDGYLVCSQGSCTNGFADASGAFNVFGGTSVSTPSFAGILALLEQKIQTKVGNANPTLYGLANSTYYGTVFHDVTSGTNAVPCSAGSTGCASGEPAYNPPATIACPANSCSGLIAYSSIGYSAGTGYDLTTGWGSIDVNNMVTDWLLATPTGRGSLIGTTASATTLSTPSTSIPAGTAVTLTAAVTSGATTSTAVPTGTVQLLIDNAATGSAVALVSGTATLTAATTNLSSGSHTFSVSYSGDATYAGSKGSVVVDFTSTTTADFAVSPASTTVTVASGATASGLTYTVTGLNGFTGNVNFTATTTSSSLNATYAFSVNPVVVTSTAAGTTVFTLEAFTNPTAQGSFAKPASKRQASAQEHGTPWMVGASGVSLASLLLFVLPRRRRRWAGLCSGLLVVLLSVVALSTSGCVGNQGTAVSSTLNATPGTYPLTVTASGTNAAGATLSHSVSVTFVVQ